MSDYLIRIIDFETTGLTLPDAEVIEVGTCDVDVVNRVVHEPKSWLCGVSSNPAETRAVHHIRSEEVAGLAPFDGAALCQQAKEDGIVAMGAHNIEFEWQFIAPHVCLPMLCTLKVASRVWPEAPRHQNTVLRYWLEDQGLLPHGYREEWAMPPHRAGPDAYVTGHVMLALFDTGTKAKDMVQMTREPRFQPRCSLGKFRNRPWPEVDQGFLEWITRQQDMDADTIWNAQREIDRRSGRLAL